MGKNIGQNMSKSLSSKNSQRFLDHDLQPATDAFKTSSKTVIQKTVEATGNLIGKKYLDKVARASKMSPKIMQKQVMKKYLEKNIYHLH